MKAPKFTKEQIRWLENGLFQKLSIACVALGNLKHTLEEFRRIVNNLHKDAIDNESDREAN